MGALAPSRPQWLEYWTLLGIIWGPLWDPFEFLLRVVWDLFGDPSAILLAFLRLKKEGKALSPHNPVDGESGPVMYGLCASFGGTVIVQTFFFVPVAAEIHEDPQIRDDIPSRPTHGFKSSSVGRTRPCILPGASFAPQKDEQDECCRPTSNWGDTLIYDITLASAA